MHKLKIIQQQLQTILTDYLVLTEFDHYMIQEYQYYNLVLLYNFRMESGGHAESVSDYLVDIEIIQRNPDLTIAGEKVESALSTLIDSLTTVDLNSFSIKGIIVDNSIENYTVQYVNEADVTYLTSGPLLAGDYQDSPNSYQNQFYIRFKLSNSLEPTDTIVSAYLSLALHSDCTDLQLTTITIRNTFDRGYPVGEATLPDEIPGASPQTSFPGESWEIGQYTNLDITTQIQGMQSVGNWDDNYILLSIISSTGGDQTINQIFNFESEESFYLKPKLIITTTKSDAPIYLQLISTSNLIIEHSSETVRKIGTLKGAWFN